MFEESYPTKLRRSILITPLFDERIIEKSATSDADVVWLEVEDGAHTGRKGEARSRAVEALKNVNWGSKERIVRINPPTTEFGLDDVREIAAAGPNALMIAKARTPEDIEAVDGVITEVLGSSSNNDIEIWIMCETAQAMHNVERIAEASPRMGGMLFGGGDLSADLRTKRIHHLFPEELRTILPREGVPTELIYHKSRMILACRVAGINCFEMPLNAVRNLDAIERHANYAFQLGFDGIAALSPKHIPLYHRAYGPSADDLAWAETAITRLREVEKEGSTVFSIGDEFFDGPSFRNAFQLIERQALADPSYVRPASYYDAV